MSVTADIVHCFELTGFISAFGDCQVRATTVSYSREMRLHRSLTELPLQWAKFMSHKSEVLSYILLVASGHLSVTNYTYEARSVETVCTVYSYTQTKAG